MDVKKMIILSLTDKQIFYNIFSCGLLYKSVKRISSYGGFLSKGTHTLLSSFCRRFRGEVPFYPTDSFSVYFKKLTDINSSFGYYTSLILNGIDTYKSCARMQLRYPRRARTLVEHRCLLKAYGFPLKKEQFIKGCQLGGV